MIQDGGNIPLAAACKNGRKGRIEGRPKIKKAAHKKRKSVFNAYR